MQARVGKRHKNNRTGSEVMHVKQSVVRSGHLPVAMWLLGFLKTFPGMIDILYLYILDQKV